ncbi:vicilin-like seed storage protein At2g18540 isoform X2 [Pomacea canaliculata]|uniref:vicilin-like seed storage protein At2g18540 isoform X2 n=1 Tax=Pomacea canaliculata TaxID=400727 RepID=UPI000D73A3D5|nr:vicilin-like seed storage protein At2g18540 isoform X2 [Pomacea canaliculata]
MGEITVVDDKQILQNVFYQYETECKGELTPIQVQTLHSDMRIGGLSFEQVTAAIQYTCVEHVCTMSELKDLLQEMDRRYFLLQDLRWEFSVLDREGKDTITIEQARWLTQAVHGKYFSRRKWDHFLKSRPVPESRIGFAEIEVLLCELPSRASLEEEERLQQQEEKEKLWRKIEFEEALKQERENMKKEKELEKKKKIKAKEDKEEERRREEEQRTRLEEEKLRIEQEKKGEKEKDNNLDILREEAEKAEKEASDRLQDVTRRKRGASDKERRELEDEEKRLHKVAKENKHKRIRIQLKVAIKSQEKFQLEYSIKEFQKAELSDDDMDLEKAVQLLRKISAKDGLHQAMNKREITELERAMAFVREHGYHADLEKEMASAGHLLGRLKRLERIRHEILELKQSTVAEIRSYTNPPPVVHSVMTAVFLLLGHKEKETKDWKAVQALVGKTGKESLKRRCLELKSDSLTDNIVQRAKALLEKFALDEVRDISAGAATFYVWATATIEDFLDRGDKGESTPEV